MNLQEFRPHFDEYLHTRLDKKLSEVRHLFPDERTFELLSYLKPYVDHGKRFRPYMVYLGYSLYGGEDSEYITQVGLVFELIHIFALIHDDICDEGILRHQIPSYHKQLADKYNDDHVGVSQAMLVGDLVYTWALQEAQLLLSQKRAHGIVFDMLNEVVIGQMLDVEYSTPSSEMKSTKQIANKDHLKSGQYTFQKPMMVGASLAGVDDIAAIEKLGWKIGVAFQMRDDLLDWIPNKEGKTKMSDIQEGNQTVVMTTCREEYDEVAWNRLRDMKGRSLTTQEIDELQYDFETYGIAEKVLVKIHTYLDEVEKEFGQLGVTSEMEQYFYEIITLLRSK